LEIISFLPPHINYAPEPAAGRAYIITHGFKFPVLVPEFTCFVN